MFRAGDAADAAYIIIEGRVRMEGEGTEPEFVDAGQAIGILSIVADGDVESGQGGLEAVHPLHATRGMHTLPVQRPGFLDEVIRVAAQLLLQLGTYRFRVGADVPVERAQPRGFMVDIAGHLGISLPNADRNQGHRQPVKHHDGLHHGAGELGILVADTQTCQNVTANQHQANQGVKTQRTENDGPGG